MHDIPQRPLRLKIHAVNAPDGFHPFFRIGDVEVWMMLHKSDLTTESVSILRGSSQERGLFPEPGLPTDGAPKR